MSKEDEQHWVPPTPRSTFVPLPPATLPVDHLVLLPPPLIPHDQPSAVSALNSTSRPTLPSLRDSFASAPASPPIEQDDVRDNDWLPTSAAFAKRPRRSAAIVAARNIPRQPSPFDLEGGAEDDDDDAESASATPPPGASSARAGGSSASKRKVSHSLIERRRREKINDCLTTLRETVPSLKEEGERKLARAKERGRKRGRGSDAGERGGLHKLEILQGTIQYIDGLRARIEELEASTPTQLRSPASSSGSQMSLDAACESQPTFDSAAKSDSNVSLAPPLLYTPSFESSTGPVDDHEASLLLLEFSTSPELRPVAV
ncbi:hypothetical protein JCM10449v2_001655 [Rhodotorula kratochvilovae]